MFPATRGSTRWMYARVEGVQLADQIRVGRKAVGVLDAAKGIARRDADAHALATPDLHDGGDDLEEEAGSSSSMNRRKRRCGGLHGR